jgi:AhpD family alkylhydroperoxidase
MGKLLDDYNSFRDRLNQKILAVDNMAIKRFFAVDTITYHDGALSSKTKEMLGLASSMVLRCDDCIRYHLVKCHQQGVTKEEFFEIFSVALVVGGSIVIPHIRRAVEFLEDMQGN